MKTPRCATGSRLLLLAAAITLAASAFSQSPVEVKKIRTELKYQYGNRTIKLKKEIEAIPGTSYYFSEKSNHRAGIFAVHVPSAINNKKALPLMVSSHGMGGDGINEMGMWSGLAEQYGFIAVTPSFACATGAGGIDVDHKMLCDIMERVLAKLPVDREFVLGTGFSGGGLPAYLIMMRHPEWFTMLCFRGPNFRGLGMRGPWRERPVYIFWGEKDHPLILNADGPNGLAALLKMKGLSQEYDKRKDPMHFVSADGKFQWDLVPGGGHDPCPGMCAKWFASFFKKNPAGVIAPANTDDDAGGEEDDSSSKPRPPWMR